MADEMNSTDRLEVRSERDKYGYIVFFLDVLHSHKLTPTELAVFITLKSFVKWGSDEIAQTAFPSYQTIAKLANVSKRTAQRAIDSLIDKGVIIKTQRYDKQHGQTSNLYQVLDYASTWENNTPNSDEEMAKAISLLVANGYDVTPHREKKKEHRTEIKGQNTHRTEKAEDIQEEYPLQMLKSHFRYDDIVTDMGEDRKNEVDAVFNLLYRTCNTKSRTVRIGGSDYNAKTVISVLMKLTPDGIKYSLQKYSDVEGKINNPDAYLLTILFKAEGQMELDYKNDIKTAFG